MVRFGHVDHIRKSSQHTESRNFTIYLGRRNAVRIRLFITVYSCL